MNKSIVCFSANRTCHHDDYFLLISTQKKAINVKNSWLKLKYLLSNKAIMFFDIDSRDLIFLPLILLRSIWTNGNYAISVRTEYLIEGGTFKEFLKKPEDLIFFKSYIKKNMFRVIKCFSNTNLISIHKNHPFEKIIGKYVNSFIYDPQLWDLNVLSILKSKPPEIDENIFHEMKKTVLVAGRLNGQRSKSELIDYLKINKTFNFIIAGNVQKEDLVILKELENCLVLNRFLSNEELLYLLNKCHIIYCFYTNDRPSGFFGRALQLNKPIIVRENRYLDRMFLEYKNLIKVKSLNQLPVIVNSFESEIYESNIFDDSKYFFNML
ncbi:hypothetical protein [Polaribacter glomeratus]|uniref:Glycosyl transferase family 1 domain-containing protein n=1 Tax=Polaribacter glomeratus TaxID=102 RepID=A0A2S7WU24_9FLAO|nr:hypothetical protein [Polaribacter glomeratus]PQJ81100.1 hypothetical protein BTO16_00190 [Polaribacter glomeratus]TXD65652.1 hypothetical protein ESX12_08450 [Polaribacter glomeratus]